MKRRRCVRPARVEPFEDGRFFAAWPDLRVLRVLTYTVRAGVTALVATFERSGWSRRFVPIRMKGSLAILADTPSGAAFCRIFSANASAVWRVRVVSSPARPPNSIARSEHFPFTARANTPQHRHHVEEGRHEFG